MEAAGVEPSRSRAILLLHNTLWVVCHDVCQIDLGIHVCWLNPDRLLQPIGHGPRTEKKEAFYDRLEVQPKATKLNSRSRR